MHQRPAHLFARHHANRIAFGGIPGEAAEHAAGASVDHRRVDDDALDFGRFQNTLQIWHHPCECRQGTERRRLRRDSVAGGAEQPAAAGVDETWSVSAARRARAAARSSSLRSIAPIALSKSQAEMNHRVDGRHTPGAIARAWRYRPQAASRRLRRISPPRHPTAPAREHHGRAG